jgi:hypothetical protein
MRANASERKVIMLTFDEAKRILAKRETKKLARNTYLREVDGRMVVRFWETDIITIDKQDTYTLNSGGYRTLTTKDRFNSFAPVWVWQHRNMWYAVPKRQAHTLEPFADKVLFADGMRVDASGKVLSGAGNDETRKVMGKVDRLVSKYIAGYAAHVMVNGLEQDTSGDCWGCLMQDTADKVKEPMGYSHYINHFEEKYYVPVILIKALQEVGYINLGLIWGMMEADISRGREPYHLKHALRKYFRTRKQGIAEAIAKP